MKWLKYLLLGALSLVGLFSLPGLIAEAQVGTQNFAIKSFEADYFLDRTPERVSTLTVSEKIVAQFPDFDQNHGILRAIPRKYQNHTLSLKIESVKGPSGNLNFETYNENDNLVLKIGDADRFVQGEQTYLISYSMRNVINFLEDHQEFYWDINGDQWSQPFGSVTARIHLPNQLRSQRQPVCFMGYFGQSSSSGCQIQSLPQERGGDLLVASAENLSPNQTLTVAAGFDKDSFVLGPEIARERRNQALKKAGVITAIIMPPLIAASYMFNRWHHFGRDPRGKGLVVPEYQAPKGLNVLSSDFLLHERLRNLAITALIIELAIRGYLAIHEIKQAKRLRRDSQDYELELLKEPHGLNAQERKVMQMLFDSSPTIGQRVKVSELKQKLYKDAAELGKAQGLKLMALGYFRNDPAKTRSRYFTAGIVIIIFGVVPAFFGFFWLLSLVSAGLIVLGFANRMPARTKLGADTRDYLLGLKSYIGLAEADRLKYLQSPSGAEKIAHPLAFNPTTQRAKVKLFEGLLPYAMIFGLEKDWAKQFQDIYASPPDWYHGNWASFNAGYLSSSLSSFSAASSASFSSPSSSSGSGFSGGSSGGGGGGGGGGGW